MKTNAYAKLLRTQKYRQLPDILKSVMLWSKWLLWDAKKTGTNESLDEYWQMRNWMQHVLLFTYKLDDNIAPEITEDNYLQTWFELDKLLNKDEIKKMTHINYNMVWKYNGITPVDLTAPIK